MGLGASSLIAKHDHRMLGNFPARKVLLCCAPCISSEMYQYVVGVLNCQWLDLFSFVLHRLCSRLHERVGKIIRIEPEFRPSRYFCASVYYLVQVAGKRKSSPFLEPQSLFIHRQGCLGALSQRFRCVVIYHSFRAEPCASLRWVQLIRPMLLCDEKCANSYILE